MTDKTQTVDKKVAISLANGDMISGEMWGYPDNNRYLEIDSVKDNKYDDKPICATIDGHEIEKVNIHDDRIFIRLWNRTDKNFEGNVCLTIQTKHIEVSKA